MRPRFPVRICEKLRVEHETLSGFSLIEVLVCLLVLGLLSVAMGQAVFLSIRAEQHADHSREAIQHWHTLMTRHWTIPSSAAAADDLWDGWVGEAQEVALEFGERERAGSLHEYRSKDGVLTTQMLITRVAE